MSPSRSMVYPLEYSGFTDCGLSSDREQSGPAVERSRSSYTRPPLLGVTAAGVRTLSLPFDPCRVSHTVRQLRHVRSAALSSRFCGRCRSVTLPSPSHRSRQYSRLSPPEPVSCQRLCDRAPSQGVVRGRRVSVADTHQGNPCSGSDTERFFRPGTSRVTIPHAPHGSSGESRSV